ncbi:MAG: HlyD family efflux transporter periplasmic adaptor subunit [Pirellulales bacterium]
MKRHLRDSLPWLSFAALIAVLLGYLMWPAAIAVDVSLAARTSMQVTIDEDGRTRVKERYIIAAPLEGELLRVPWHAGDPIVAGETLLAAILPPIPSMLDARVRSEAEARVRVAQAALAQAERRVAEAQELLAFAKHAFERARDLHTRQAITTEEYETTEHRERIAMESVRAAEFGRQMTKFEVELAQAALLRFPADESTQTKPTVLPAVAERFEIRSPITGNIFRVLQESSMVVRSGTPLMEIGNLQDLEIEIDLLSSDAVRVRPGAKVLLEHWGGPTPLEARVRLIEPSGFTKISALGVEEQRVNVIADFVEPPAKRPRLGDGFRVEARVVEWETDEALTVPAGALFRSGEGWAVFTVGQGRARLTPVQIGHHNGRQVEILGGLQAGHPVIVHPSDQVRDGSRVR